MAPDVSEIARALLALAPEDRAAVIERGLRGLDDVDDVDQAEVDAGEHFAQIRAKLTPRAK
ncbi:hypothetical protein [Georgenia sp. MJ170]|uniref:hypothetical protein n=1 Tax=Georgenia sunbinii TaxID=3117728 RepID=UPI002F26ADEB